MLVVKKVEVVEVDSDTFRQYHTSPTANYVDPSEVTTEEIRGERFSWQGLNEERTTVCIGLSKAVKDALRLPLWGFEDMSHKNKDLSDSNIDLKKERNQFENQVLKYKSMGFFARLKFLFTGEV